jgi:hypothetical protein
MAKIRALVSFTGALCMRKNEVKECSCKATLRDLLRAKYVEEVKPEKSVKRDEGK